MLVSTDLLLFTRHSLDICRRSKRSIDARLGPINPQPDRWAGAGWAGWPAPSHGYCLRETASSTSLSHKRTSKDTNQPTEQAACWRRNLSQKKSNFFPSNQSSQSIGLHPKNRPGQQTAAVIILSICRKKKILEFWWLCDCCFAPCVEGAALQPTTQPS